MHLRYMSKYLQSHQRTDRVWSRNQFSVQSLDTAVNTSFICQLHKAVSCWTTSQEDRNVRDTWWGNMVWKQHCSNYLNTVKATQVILPWNLKAHFRFWKMCSLKIPLCVTTYLRVPVVVHSFNTYPVILWVMILTPKGDSPIALKACLMKFSSMYGSN